MPHDARLLASVDFLFSGFLFFLLTVYNELFLNFHDRFLPRHTAPHIANRSFIEDAVHGREGEASQAREEEQTSRRCERMGRSATTETLRWVVSRAKRLECHLSSRSSTLTLLWWFHIDDDAAEKESSKIKGELDRFKANKQDLQRLMVSKGAQVSHLLPSFHHPTIFSKIIYFSLNICICWHSLITEVFCGNNRASTGPKFEDSLR